MTEEETNNDGGLDSGIEGTKSGDHPADGYEARPDDPQADHRGEHTGAEDAAERSFSALEFDQPGDAEIRLTNAERTDLEDSPAGSASDSTRSSRGHAAGSGSDQHDESEDGADDDLRVREPSDHAGDDDALGHDGNESDEDAEEHPESHDGESESADSESTEISATSGTGVTNGVDSETAGADSEEKPAAGRRRRREPAKSKDAATGAASKRRATKTTKPVEPMLILVNDTPSEECRIAVLESKRLQSYFAERATTATNVGNIYKGRVINVEPAIQAAFVDFGTGANGFLHISDLHPKYFPGNERTERVGKKIPRRDRPLIQEALKRGQEIVVQVIKEGLGSKGPTVTSYISIPGRLLVMMPDMDRVGVSRKVEDEDQRRQMRKILDSLDLPEGFGFILRTAGFDRTKTELQRDAAYLTRLWKVMEKRMDRTGGPCELYTESDLLIRTLRDFADPAIEAIVVDSSSAYERASMFLEVVAPRSAPKILFWDRPYPLFDAYGVERQIDEIHARTVSLRSGGALVFDQAEALVAIDVNSGKSRSARDSETNAYNTNLEAVSEICRQLRMRDLGGLIVMDFIDMRSYQHRRAVEDQLREELKRDRAKTTFLPISDFGMIEMTRQRMRPSLRKTHYFDCPHCAGHGELRMPDTVASEALRRIAVLFAHERVRRVELVCSARVAAELLSSKRRAMHELESRFGKRIDVRISEAFAVDRTEVYAYDDRNSDIEVERLPALPAPAVADLPSEPAEPSDDGEDSDESMLRRRRRRRKPAPADATAIALAGGFDDLPELDDSEAPILEAIEEEEEEEQSDAGEEDRHSEPRGRGRRGGRGEQPASGGRTPSEDCDGSGNGRGRNRRRRRRKSVAIDALATELRTDRQTILAKLREQLSAEDAGVYADDAVEVSGDHAAMLRNTLRPAPMQRPEGSAPGMGGRGRSRRRRRRGNLLALPVPVAPLSTLSVADECNVSVGELLDHLRCSVDEATAAGITDEIAELDPQLVMHARYLHAPRWALEDLDGGGGESAEGGSDPDSPDQQTAESTHSDGDAPPTQDRDGSGRRGRGRRVRGRGRGRNRGDGGNSGADSHRSPESPNGAPAEGAPPSGSTPSAGDRAPASKDRAPASKDRAPASKDRAPASNDRAPASNDRAPASNDRAPASNDHAPASPAASQPARRSLYGSVFRKLGFGRGGSGSRDE